MFNLFKKRAENVTNVPSSNNNNFDNIISKVKKMNFQDGQTVLWREVFKLEKWYVIVKPLNSETDKQNPTPFIGDINGQGWMYLFTDNTHARLFGETQGLVNEEGNVNTIALTPNDAIVWLYKYRDFGVFGVRFNEGDYGWFSPIDNLKPIMEFLKI